MIFSAKLKTKIAIGIISIFAIFSVASSASAAYTVSLNGTTTTGTILLQPNLVNGITPILYGSYYIASSVTASSSLSRLNVQGLGAAWLCLGTDCRTAWPTGSAASAYEIATTTDIAVPQLTYIVKTSGRTTLGSVATSSASCSAGISCSAFTVVGVVSPSITLIAPVTIALGGSNNTGAIGASSTVVVSDGTRYQYYRLSAANFTTPNISQWTNDSGYITTATASGYPFPGPGNSTSTAVGFTGGLYTFGSTTIQFASTTALTVSGVGGLYVGTLTGPLQAIAGKVTATSTVSVFYGGTGLNAVGASSTVLMSDGTVNRYLTLSPANFTTPNISQWTNNSGYLTNANAVTSVATNNGLTGGTITTTGTVGLIITGLSTNGLVSWNGTNLIATGTTGTLTVPAIIATSTASSTFVGGVDAVRFCITGTTKCLAQTTGTVTSVATNNGLTGGAITTSGTLGFDLTKLPVNNLILTYNGSQLQATGTTNLTAGYFTATNTVASILPYASTTAITASTELNLPNGAAPVFTANGDAAVDTTADQFIYKGAFGNQVISATTSKSFNIGSTTLDAMGKYFSLATSTFLLANMPEPMTLVGFYCTASSTGAALVRFGDNANWTETGSCTGGVFTPTVTNNTWTAFEPFVVQASSTAPTGSVSRITVTAVLKVTRQ